MMMRNVVFLFVLFLCGCSNKEPELEKTLIDKDSVISSQRNDCIFDINAFEMRYLEDLNFVQELRLDSNNTKAVGKLENGYSFNCKIFVCDTWGFKSFFEKKIDSEKFVFDTNTLLELFSILPTTPNKEVFKKKIIDSKDIKGYSADMGDQTIDLSDSEISEFTIKFEKRTDTFRVLIDLTAYN